MGLKVFFFSLLICSFGRAKNKFHAKRGTAFKSEKWENRTHLLRIIFKVSFSFWSSRICLTVDSLQITGGLHQNFFAWIRCVQSWFSPDWPIVVVQVSSGDGGTGWWGTVPHRIGSGGRKMLEMRPDSQAGSRNNVFRACQHGSWGWWIGGSGKTFPGRKVWKYWGKRGNT